MRVNWTELKTFIDDRKLSPQYAMCNNNYYVQILDGLYNLECVIPNDDENDDQIDFVANYKNNGNKVRYLQIACMSGAVNETGGVGLTIKVPGAIGSGGRFVDSGEAFFDTHHVGDKLIKMELVDLDNILGYGAGLVMGSYCDAETPSDNSGWYFPPTGILIVDKFEKVGFIPSGFYFRVSAQKAAGQTTGTLYANIKWAKYM